MMKKHHWTLFLCLLALVALLAACSSEKPATTEQPAAPAAAQPAAAPVDKANAGSVSGTVKFAGAKPKAQKIDMSQDPACAQAGANMVENVSGDADNLANVYVYVKEGLGNYSYPAPAAATLDQKGCRYHPHVMGVMVGQTVQILNSDPTTHNIHPTPANNREWNESQPPKAAALEKTFAREEVMLPVKCNQHPWMKMYINVSKSPYFAVSGADGKFEINDLPPGTYTLAAVHEKLGEQTQQVTLGAKEAKTVSFSFKPAGGGD